MYHVHFEKIHWFHLKVLSFIQISKTTLIYGEINDLFSGSSESPLEHINVLSYGI